MADEKQAGTRGFAALGTMATDAESAARDLELATASAQAVAHRQQPAVRDGVSTPSSVTSPSAPTAVSSGEAPGRSMSNVGVIIGVGAVIAGLGGLLILGELNRKKEGLAGAPTVVVEPAAAPAAPTIPPPPPGYVLDEPSRRALGSDEAESPPPVGRDRVLSVSEIRYCVCEDIRLAGMKSVVDSYSEESVATFNRFVRDYNSRCGAFRYRRGALENIQREVEPRRGSLEAEGAGRLIGGR